MRQWLPAEADVDLADAYRAMTWAPPGRAGIALDMVVGIDGGVTIDGRSGALGGEADRSAFLALRDAADVILAGAGTVRTENYGPPVLREDAAARRLARGREAVATLVIVSGSLDLDLGMRAFSNPERLPIVVTTETSSPEVGAELQSRGIEVWRLGTRQVDLVALRDRLGDRGWRQVLCEGGPTLNASLFARHLVDEIFVSIAPTVTFSERHLVAPSVTGPVPLELVGVLHEGGELLLRYRIRHGAG